MDCKIDLSLVQKKLRACHLLSPDIFLEKTYREALSGPLKEYPANKKLLEGIARYVVKKYYPTYHPSSLQFDITPPSDENYASVLADPSRTAPPPIQVPCNTFSSPVQLVSTIGHEIIHQFQLQRNYSSVYQLGLNDIIRNFWELEAHTWELDPKSYHWIIGDSQAKISGCLTKEEIAETKSNQDYYGGEVKKRIGDLVSGPRSSAYIPSLEKWLHLDEWVSSVWLKDPKNKDWKTWK